MITHQAALKETRPNTTPFFSEVGLRKFVLASELFIPRPYFICHSTAKRCAKISWLPLQFILRRRQSKLKLKWKISYYICLLRFLAKEGVGKRFFDLFQFQKGIKFHIKVNSSLARVFQKVVGIGFFLIWFEVRFFNFATNKANCDWLILILNMAHFNINNYQNKTINTLIVSALRSQQVQELEDFINITQIFQTAFPRYWILRMFQLRKQYLPCLAILLKRSEYDVANIVKKPINL